MNCQAINVTSPVLKLCRNYAKTGQQFCGLHQDISPEEHRQRWTNKFLMATDDRPFYFKYDERKRERIMQDLKTGIIKLTAEDIKSIPCDLKYLDIFVLLVEHKYADIFDNNLLYYLSMHYLFNYFLSLPSENGFSMDMWPILPKKIVDVLILSNQETLCSFLQKMGLLFQKPTFRNLETLLSYIPSLNTFLEFLLESQAGRTMCWNPSYNLFTKHYTDIFATDHPLTMYMKDQFIPQIARLYQQQKQKQKDRMDILKDELIAISWHPDRFMAWCLDEEEKKENKRLFG